MINRKTEIIIAALVIIVLIVLLGWFFLFRNPSPPTTPVDEISEETTNDGTQPIVEEPVKFEPEPVARAFVERFGSYSTESNYQNVEDVMALSTPELQSELSEIAERARNEEGSGYYGVSTSVISVEILDPETPDTQTTIKLKTQRQESFDSPANTSVRYQDITLTLTLVGEKWLVSDFVWQ